MPKCAKVKKSVSCPTLQKEQNFVLVICDGKEFSVLQDELVSESLFFSALFNSSMIETVTRKVSLQNIKAEIFQVVLQYLKCKNLDLPDNFELLKSLLVAADYLQIAELSEKSGRSLVKYITDANVIGLKEFSLYVHHKLLKDEIDKHIAKNLMFYISNNFILNLQFEEIKKLVCHSDSSLDCDNRISCVLSWIKHSVENRDQYLNVLLELDHRTLTKKYCLSLLDEESLVSSQETISEFLLTKATENSKKLVIFSKRCAQWFLFANKTWTTIELPVEISKHTLITCFDEEMYFFGTGLKDGGWNWSRKLTDNFKYDPAGRTLQKIESMPKNIAFGKATSMGDKIYVVGSIIGSSNQMTVVQAYHPSTNTWNVLPPLKQFHSNPDIVAYSNCIYVATCRIKVDIEMFDIEGEKWERLPPLEGVEVIQNSFTKIRRMPYDYLLLCDQNYDISLVYHIATCGKFLYVLRTFLKTIPNIGLPPMILNLLLLRFSFESRKWSMENLAEGPKTAFHFISGYKSCKGMLPYFTFYEPDRLMLHEFYPVENKWNSYTVGWSIIQNIVKHVLIS